MSCNIHPTAILAAEVELGVDVQIGPFTIIGPNVKLGDRCNLHAHVHIECNTELGPDNEVFQFASLGAKPQDLKFQGEASTLVLGSANVIRESVTLHRGTVHGHMKTVIGDGNLFMAYSHVGHDCIVGDRNVFANSATLAGHVTVGSNAVLGGLVAIHQFARIGDFAFLGGGAMVSQDAPPYCLAQGDRCHIRGVNLIGLQRAGFTKEQIAEIKRAYHLLFGRGGHLKNNIPEVPVDLAEKPHIKALLDFVSGTQRGLLSMRGHRSGEE